jgi:glycyl-tRNA synthetase beta chain
VLVSEMRGHQKYFAVRKASGELMPNFVAVSNTRVKDPQKSRKGYERVLRARLSDGKFFFDEDRKSPLRSRVEKLGRRTFLAGLGTEHDRIARLRELSLWLHGSTGKAQPAELAEAAELCKADLTTGMVGEFPELQGSMGRVYALHDGVSKTVADAVFEHYLPRGAEDKLPEGDTGALLGIADRIDQLVGLFGIGKEPTGAADPYGQRRAALGLIRLTLAKGYRYDLYAALRYAQEQHAKNEKVSRAQALLDKIWAFLLGRLEVQLKDRAQPDSIQAALHTGAHDLVSLEKRVLALQEVRTARKAQFEATAAAFKRIANILAQAREKKLGSVALQPGLAKLPAEQALFAAFDESKNRLATALDEGEDYPAAYAALADLRPAVDAFFDDVMVMDPDEKQRDNRLALLRGLHELFAPLADFGRLQVDKSA